MSVILFYLFLRSPLQPLYNMIRSWKKRRKNIRVIYLLDTLTLDAATGVGDSYSLKQILIVTKPHFYLLRQFLMKIVEVFDSVCMCDSCTCACVCMCMCGK